MPELNIAFVGVCTCDRILFLAKLEFVNAARCTILVKFLQ